MLGFFLFFWNAFIQLFTELSWVIEALCCHDISPLKIPAIARIVVVQFPVLLSCLAFSKDFSASLFIAALIIEAIAKNVASTNQPEYAAKVT